MEYHTRALDSVLDEVLTGVVAVALQGAKGVGKTATASRRANTLLNLADPAVHASLTANLSLVTQVEPPVLVDEWQLAAPIWDTIRTAVDADPRAAGRFLLTGSAGAPPHERIHSGAGRILRLTMRPMAMSERGIAVPQVSLRDLRAGETPIGGHSPLELRDYVDEILRSGFPAIRNLPQDVRERQLDSYIDLIVDKDMPENGYSVRRPAALLRWFRAYATAISSTTEFSKILNAATAGESDKPARNTVEQYREQLTRLFILDPVDAWIPTFNPLKRLTSAPKHQLVDPALAARMVGVGADGLLIGQGDSHFQGTGTWLGALFESLAIQSVRVYADAMNARVGHLRTKGGEHEVDIIVETSDRSIIAFEVKLSATIGDDDVKHLHWLGEQIGPTLKNKVVLNTGPFAYRRPDGVAVVPLALLGP